MAAKLINLTVFIRIGWQSARRLQAALVPTAVSSLTDLVTASALHLFPGSGIVIYLPLISQRASIVHVWSYVRRI